MGAERKRNRIRSLIDELPEAERWRVDVMLGDVRYTYQDISDMLKEAGYEISKSSVGRYAARSSDAARRLQDIRARTDMLIKAAKEGQDLQSGEVAVTMLMDMLVQRLATAEDEIENVPINQLSNMLSQLMRTSVYKNRYKDNRKKTIDELQENIMSRVRELVQEDSELVDKLLLMVQDAAIEEAAKDGT